MADNLTESEVFRQEAETQFARLQSFVVEWHDVEHDAHEMMLMAIDEATTEIMTVMAEQEPASSNLKRRKWFLKAPYVQYLKDKHVPVSNSAEYPFNAPFKLVLYPTMDWGKSVVDPEALKQRRNAESEISHWANVAALSLVRECKPSELIAQYGSVRAASEAFVVVDADEKAREQAEARRKAQEKRDADAAERKEARERAEAGRKAAEEAERKSKAAETAAKKEQQEIERAAKEAARAANEAERKRLEAEAANRKADQLRQEQAARQKRAEEQQEKLDAERVKREQEAEEARIANEKREAELAAEKARQDAEAQQLEEERKLAEKAAKAEQRKYKLSVSKDRNDLLTEDMRATGAWLRVEWRDGEWYVTTVRPARETLHLVVPEKDEKAQETEQDEKPDESASSV